MNGRQRSELDAMNSQIERCSRAARNVGFDPRDYDDLIPARPLVWLLLAWAMVVVVLLLVLAPSFAYAQERGVIMLGAWHEHRTYYCESPAPPPAPDLRPRPLPGTVESLKPLPPLPAPQPGGTYDDYHAFTPGLGFGWDITPQVMASGGLWQNSHGNVAPFALIDWRPLQWDVLSARASLGLFAGASGGYCRHGKEGSILPLGGLTLRIDIQRVALHILALPPTSYKPATVGLAVSVAL